MPADTSPVLTGADTFVKSPLRNTGRASRYGCTVTWLPAICWSLCAVIDFGCSAVGDPACDLAIAWTFLSRHSREALRRACDEPTYPLRAWYDEVAWVPAERERRNSG